MLWDTRQLVCRPLPATRLALELSLLLQVLHRWPALPSALSVGQVGHKLLQSRLLHGDIGPSCDFDLIELVKVLVPRLLTQYATDDVIRSLAAWPSAGEEVDGRTR